MNKQRINNKQGYSAVATESIVNLANYNNNVLNGVSTLIPSNSHIGNTQNMME